MIKLKNSIVLMSYLSLASVYYLFGDVVRLLIFVLALLLSLYMGTGVTNNKITFKIPNRVFWIMLTIFTISVAVQLINLTLTPFVIYYLSTPLVAYFIYRKEFNSKLISIPFYGFSLYSAIYFLMHRSLLGIMGEVSENYVSVVLIMNIAIIYLIKIRQKEKLSIFPAALALFIAILAIGRSGIITTLFILLLVLWVRWRNQRVTKQILYAALILIPMISVVILKWELIETTFYQMEVFEKFTKDGVSSPSRDIIKRAYLSNIDAVTFFTGYDYRENHWFQHYGLNPHNSYIKLHHYSGVAFFIVLPLIFIGLAKLVRKNIFFSGLLVAILLRSWTDSVLFLTLFDFVPIVLLLIAFYDRKGSTKIA